MNKSLQIKSTSPVYNWTRFLEPEISWETKRKYEVIFLSFIWGELLFLNFPFEAKYQGFIVKSTLAYLTKLRLSSLKIEKKKFKRLQDWPEAENAEIKLSCIVTKNQQSMVVLGNISWVLCISNKDSSAPKSCLTPCLLFDKGFVGLRYFLSHRY